MAKAPKVKPGKNPFMKLKKLKKGKKKLPKAPLMPYGGKKKK